MADHDDAAALLAHLADLDMHLGHSGQVASNTLSPRSSASRRIACDTPCALNISVLPERTCCRSFDEHRALGAQIIDHEFVVHHLMAHVDGRAVTVPVRVRTDADGAFNARPQKPRGWLVRTSCLTSKAKSNYVLRRGIGPIERTRGTRPLVYPPRMPHWACFEFIAISLNSRLIPSSNRKRVHRAAPRASHSGESCPQSSNTASDRDCRISQIERGPVPAGKVKIEEIDHVAKQDAIEHIADGPAQDQRHDRQNSLSPAWARQQHADDGDGDQCDAMKKPRCPARGSGEKAERRTGVVGQHQT